MELFNPLHEHMPIFMARLQNEYEAFHFYRNASNWCANMGYTKAAKYFTNEAQSETQHAIKIQDFLNDWGAVYSLPAISTEETFESLADVIYKAYEIEVSLYKAYSANANEIEESERSSYLLFLEFVGIQRESVAEYRTLVDKLALINAEDKFQLFVYEREVFE
jgi:ferritin